MVSQPIRLIFNSFRSSSIFSYALTIYVGWGGVGRWWSNYLPCLPKLGLKLSYVAVLVGLISVLFCYKIPPPQVRLCYKSQSYKFDGSVNLPGQRNHLQSRLYRMGPIHSRRSIQSSVRKLKFGVNHPPPAFGYFFLSFRGNKINVVNAQMQSSHLQLLL